MQPDEELVVIFAILHLCALLLGAALFMMFLRSDSRPRSESSDDDEDNGGGGGNDRITDKPKTSPSGGIPLPDAVQPAVRLRGHERHPLHVQQPYGLAALLLRLRQQPQLDQRVGVLGVQLAERQPGCRPQPGRVAEQR